MALGKTEYHRVIKEKKMDLKKVRNILSIAQHGSISAASRELFITPVSLWEQTNQLEDELGFKIFARSTRGVTLTAAGQQFCEYMRKAISDMDAMIDGCRALSALAPNLIHVSVYQPYVFPDFCSRYGKLYPEVFFRFSQSDYSYGLDIAKYFKTARLDIAQECYSPQYEKGGFCFLPFLQEPVCCFCNPDHPFASRRLISMKNLQNEDVFIAQAVSLDTKLLKRQLLQAGIHPTGTDYDDFTVIQRCMSGGIYLGEKGLREIFNNLACIPFETEIRFVHGIVYRSDAPKHVLDFVRYVENSIGRKEIEHMNQICREMREKEAQAPE